MKLFRKIFLAAIVAGIGLSFASCEKTDKNDNSDINTASYNEELLYGHWCSTSVLFDGQNVSQNQEFCFYFYENHQGLMSHNGETEHNEFGWRISGNEMIFTIYGEAGDDGENLTMSWEVTSLTATTLSLQGQMIMDGGAFNKFVKITCQKDKQPLSSPL